MPLICLDCRYIGPRVSGIAKVVQALVDFLPNLAPDIDFLLLKGPKAPSCLSEAGNVREVTIQAPANSPTTMWWLSQAVDLSKVDLFHATYNIMPAGLRMPCVTTIHDVMWLINPDWCNSGPMRFVDRAFYQHGIRRALRRSAAITTVSRSSGDQILHLAPEMSGRVHVTPLAAAPIYRQVAVTGRDLEQIGLPTGRRFVLTVGQYVPYKNHEGAIRAFAQVAATHPDVELVLVQRRNPQSERLQSLVLSLGIADRVHFLTRVSEENMTKLFSAAAALLHPSYFEGFGLPLVEAMACGCPVVASDRGSIPEVVGDAAILAAPDDHPALAAGLRSVLDDQEIAERMCRSGLARVAAMSWRRFAEGNLSAQREVLAAGSGGTYPNVR
jgi:alpha-1,3-rhamnosyl/mannosyltransferase